DRRQGQPAARERDLEGASRMTREWDAVAYQRLSVPQTGWGEKILAGLTLRGDETVIDAGCGTGKLSEKILERVPSGQVSCLDNSSEMLRIAGQNLARFGDRARFQETDLAKLDLESAADLIFSTATFHWILDHEALFRRLYRALRPGGL